MLIDRGVSLRARRDYGILDVPAPLGSGPMDYCILPTRACRHSSAMGASRILSGVGWEKVGWERCTIRTTEQRWMDSQGNMYGKPTSSCPKTIETARGSHYTPLTGRPQRATAIGRLKTNGRPIGASSAWGGSGSLVVLGLSECTGGYGRRNQSTGSLLPSTPKATLTVLCSSARRFPTPRPTLSPKPLGDSQAPE